MAKFTTYGFINDDITPYEDKFEFGVLEKHQCPECYSEDTFKTPKAKKHNYVCRECWNKF